MKHTILEGLIGLVTVALYLVVGVLWLKLIDWMAGLLSEQSKKRLRIALTCLVLGACCGFVDRWGLLL